MQSLAMATSRHFFACAAIWCFMAGALNGCAKQNSAIAVSAFETQQTVEDGPHSLEVALDQKSLTVAQTVSLKLTARTTELYRVQWPAPSEKLGDFSASSPLTNEPKLESDGRTVQEWRVVLTPFLPGEYAIPAISVTYTRANGEPASTLSTEAFTLPVASVLPAGNDNPSLVESLIPFSLPAAMSLRPWFTGAAVLALIAVSLMWMRRTRLKPTPQIPAHVRALRELELLLREGLTDRGEFKYFYIRIAEIVRRFVEDRYHLHAHDRTTEEFLESLRTTQSLSGQQKLLLKEFLSHCDLVKFAKMRPTIEEIEQTTDSCRRFIQDSAARDAAEAGAP